ncbi:MAG: hypothetical protein ACRCVX_14280 [Shewanella sp.]
MTETQKQELEALMAYYTILYKSRPKTDSVLLSTQSFAVQHYGFAGTQAINKVTEQHSSGGLITTKQPDQYSQRKPFVHPIEAARADNPASPVLGGASPLSQSAPVAVVAAEDSGEQVLKFDPKDAKAMNAKALGLKYGIVSLREYLTLMGVSYAPTTSLTQLAQLAIRHNKKA